MKRRLPSAVRRVAVVAHPGAGLGSSRAESAVQALIRSLGTVEVVAPRGTVETEAALQAGLRVQEVECPEVPGPVYAAQAALRLMASSSVDLVVAMGGDGTLAAVANALASAGGGAPPLAGIGIGSANVGPLVTVLGRDVAGLRWENLVQVAVDGLSCAVNGRDLGIAFNDLAFANTFFGTLHETRVDLDACAMLAGRREAAVPASVCGPSVRVWKNGQVVLDGREMNIGQLVACPINDPHRFMGTAASGFLSWGPYVGCHAVLAAASIVLIRTHLTIRDLLAAEPLRLCHVAFGESDTVAVSGLLPGAAVVADGSPMVALSVADRVELTLRRRAVRVLRRNTE